MRNSKIIVFGPAGKVDWEFRVHSCGMYIRTLMISTGISISMLGAEGREYGSMAI